MGCLDDIFVVRIVDLYKQVAPPELKYVGCGYCYKQNAPTEQRHAFEWVLL
jgi:hypothetical protein